MHTLQPINGQILIKLADAPEHIEGGIYVGKRDTEASLRGTVIALGAGSRAPDGSLIPFDVSVGDEVLVMTYGPVAIKLGDVKHVVAGEEHILGVVRVTQDAADGA